MVAVKTIAIIGATENMDRGVARSLSKHYNLLLMAEPRVDLSPLKVAIENGGSKNEVNLVDCAREAAWEADIIIIATAARGEQYVAEKIREVSIGKVVVSTSNPIHYTGMVTAHNTSAAEEVQDMLPYSKIVKAFNTTFTASFGAPVASGAVPDVFLAGNSSEAVTIVSALVNHTGFNAVVVGDLAVSRTLERMQLLLIQLGIENKHSWMAGCKI